MDGVKIGKLKGEHSESVVMDGVNIESWKGEHSESNRDGWSHNWKVGNGENSESIVMDAKLESWKGEHSESIVMDGSQKLESWKQ